MAEEKGAEDEAFSKEGAEGERERESAEEGGGGGEEAEEEEDAEDAEEAKEEGGVEEEKEGTRLRKGRGGRCSAEPIAGSPEQDLRELLDTCDFSASGGLCSFFFF